VRFVQDHNFASRSRRRVPHHLAQLADLVDAAVRRRVDLNHVQRGPRRNIFARIALPARLRCRPLHAIQRFRQDPRRRRFSHAPRPRKNVRVRHAVILDRVFQCFCYVLLADEIVKRLRAPLAGYDLVAHLRVLSDSFSVLSEYKKPHSFSNISTSDLRLTTKN